MFNQKKKFINDLAIWIYSKKQIDENRSRGRNDHKAMFFYKWPWRTIWLLKIVAMYHCNKNKKWSDQEEKKALGGEITRQRHTTNTLKIPGLNPGK